MNRKSSDLFEMLGFSLRRAKSRRKDRCLCEFLDNFSFLKNIIAKIVGLLLLGGATTIGIDGVGRHVAKSHKCRNYGTSCSNPL